MKLYSLVGFAAICFALFFTGVRAEEADDSAEKNDFATDFFQGMESGFFLRDKPDGYKDYDCPELAVDTDTMKVIQSVLTPIQMAVNMLNNDIANTIFSAIETFINSVLSLQATVRGYPGSEFCSGLLFGIHGSNLLLKIGKTFMLQFE